MGRFSIHWITRPPKLVLSQVQARSLELNRKASLPWWQAPKGWSHHLSSHRVCNCRRLPQQGDPRSKLGHPSIFLTHASDTLPRILTRAHITAWSHQCVTIRIVPELVNARTGSHTGLRWLNPQTSSYRHPTCFLGPGRYILNCYKM